MLNLFDKKLGDFVWVIKNQNPVVGEIVNIYIKNNSEYYGIIINNIEEEFEVSDCFTSQQEANVAAMVISAKR